MCNTNTPEEDFEMRQVAKNNGDNLMFGDADKYEGQVPESDYNELLKRFDHMCDLHGQLSTITQLLMHDGVDVEKLLNIGTSGYNMPYSKDYMDWRKHTITALTKVINVGEGKCKEWPCVGDKVEFPSGEGVVIVSKQDEQGIVIVESLDDELGNVYKRVSLKAIKKPKTPEEEELIDKIESVFRTFSANDYLRGRQRELAIKFIDDFNIKPQ